MPTPPPWLPARTCGYFSDDVVAERLHVGQRIEGRDEAVATIVELHEQVVPRPARAAHAARSSARARPRWRLLLLEYDLYLRRDPGDWHAGRRARAARPHVADGQMTALHPTVVATGSVAALTAEAPPTTGTTAP